MATQTPTEEEWFQHKPEIRRLYLMERKSAEEVRRILESKGLTVTLVQYIHALLWISTSLTHILSTGKTS